MDTNVILSLAESYQSIYSEPVEEQIDEEFEYLMEEATMVADYFYVEGLNEDGLEILIDELGVEEFVEWVEEIHECATVSLNEARAAKRASKSAKSYAQVKAEIDAKEAAKSAAKAAAKKAKTPVRAAAVKKAVETQKPTPASTPKRSVLDNLAKGIFSASDAVKKGRENAGKAFRAGMERHNKATQTAGKLAGETAKAAGKVGKIAGEFGKGVSSGVKTAGSVAKKVTEEEDKKSPEYKAKKAKAFQMKAAQAEKVKSLLVREGFASNEENAEVLMYHMSDEWFETIMEGWQRPNTGKMDKQAERHRGFTYGLGKDSAYRTGKNGESPSTVAIRRNNKMGEVRQSPTFDKYQSPKKSKVESYDEYGDIITEGEKEFPLKKVGDKMKSIDSKLNTTDNPIKKDKLKGRYNKMAKEYWA